MLSCFYFKNQAFWRDAVYNLSSIASSSWIYFHPAIEETKICCVPLSFLFSCFSFMNESLKLHSFKTGALSSWRATFIVQKANNIIKELDNNFVKYFHCRSKTTVIVAGYMSNVSDSVMTISIIGHSIIHTVQFIM